jgi:hypothetical protein
LHLLQIDGEVSKQESKASKRKAAAAERLIKKAGGSSAVKLVKGAPGMNSKRSTKSITLLLMITFAFETECVATRIMLESRSLQC